MLNWGPAPARKLGGGQTMRGPEVRILGLLQGYAQLIVQERQ